MFWKCITGFSFQTTKELRLQEVEDTLGMKNEMKTRQTPALAVPLICQTVFYVLIVLDLKKLTGWYIFEEAC